MEERLRKARGKESQRTGGNVPSSQGPHPLGVALRISTEFVAAVIVGGGIGWFLDQWLGTQPVLLLVMGVLGVITGFVNVIRTANELNTPRDK